MHVILIAIGSSGDVHPFIGIGIEMKARGHNVTVVTNGYFEPLVNRVGLTFREYGTREQFLSLTQNPDLWHPVRGFPTVMRSIAEGLDQLYHLISDMFIPGETVVAASSLALAARVAQDKLGVPMATVHLAPAIFRSVYRSPRLPGLFMPDWMPRLVKRGMYGLADTIAIRPLVDGPVNRLRRDVGLPPVRNVLADWWHSPTRTLGLFPAWFAPPQPDWPPQVRLTGFPLYDERGAAEVSADLSRFLDAGDPPIVFTPGSAMRHGRGFFTAAADACARLGRRGVLLTRFAEQVPQNLPPTVSHFDFVPFSVVLPRAAALVSHGGIGTISQGLAAGVPQLVMPLSHDQFDNAERLKRLGVGDSIKAPMLHGRTAAEKLDALLKAKPVALRCRESAATLALDHGLARVCDEIESLPALEAARRVIP